MREHEPEKDPRLDFVMLDEQVGQLIRCLLNKHKEKKTVTAFPCQSNSYIQVVATYREA